MAKPEPSSTLPEGSTNPLFVVAREESKAWVEKFCDGLGVGYSEMISRAGDFLQTGEYWNEGEKFDGEFVPDEFWEHYELIVGERVADNKRESFFSCSC